MSSSDSESETEQKQVSKEFVSKVKRWIDIDDDIRDLRAKTKELTNEKKQFEEFILTYMEQIDEPVIGVKDGKLRRNVSKTKGALKKQIIHKALVEITGDDVKSQQMTEHILNSRPTVEKVNLKRTKNRRPKN